MTTAKPRNGDSPLTLKRKGQKLAHPIFYSAYLILVSYLLMIFDKTVFEYIAFVTTSNESLVGLEIFSGSSGRIEVRDFQHNAGLAV